MEELLRFFMQKKAQGDQANAAAQQQGLSAADPAQAAPQASAFQQMYGLIGGQGQQPTGQSPFSQIMSMFGR